jgi:hypothetical protein
MPEYLDVHLMGGLGNQLFQMAALHSVARTTGRTPIVTNIAHISPHRGVSYFDTILQRWKGSHTIVPTSTIEESTHIHSDWAALLEGRGDVRMVGYFQEYRYIASDFIDTLVFPTDCLEKYPDIGTMVFLHIRGGDYIGHPVHDVGLDAYYRRAIALFPGAHFAVFTNDRPYAESKKWLRDIPHTFIDEPDVESLLLMSKCKGGICANSTFSWWGAYLNRNRTLVLPDVWVVRSTFRTDGLYVPGIMVCSTSSLTDAYCIHLPHRTDRKEHMDRLAIAYPCLRIHYIDAISHTNGVIGCNLSHKKVIREAKERGDPFVLVLEDDCDMLISNEQLSRSLDTIKDYVRLHPEVQIVNGCGNLPKFEVTSRRSHRDMLFFTSKQVFTTHFILYFASSYDAILSSSTDVPADLITNECAMVFTYPYIATQLSSYSDILKQNVNYHTIQQSQQFVESVLSGPLPRPDPLAWMRRV